MCLLARVTCSQLAFSYGLKPTHPWGMDKMDEILALLTPEEVTDALRFVEVWQKAGQMSPEEAEEWRRWIAGWERFRCRRQQLPRRPKKVDLSIVEPPDQFLC